MKIEQLFEAPLPKDWKQDIFDPSVPFSTRLKYAKERAEQIGRGSSRVAFLIPYRGRKTVLKIAINNKGQAQNEEETQLLEDGYASQIGNIIPLIDYDERSSSPTWIHTEYATKLSQKQLERFFGDVPMSTITMYLDSIQGRNRWTHLELPEHVTENENFQMLEKLVSDFGLPAGDLSRKANWGLYRGRPVIIDLGLTDRTLELYR